MILFDNCLNYAAFGGRGTTLSEKRVMNQMAKQTGRMAQANTAVTA